MIKQLKLHLFQYIIQYLGIVPDFLDSKRLVKRSLIDSRTDVAPAVFLAMACVLWMG